MEEGVRLPRLLYGVAHEAAWLSAHVALYPFGAFGAGRAADADVYSPAKLPPLQRGLAYTDAEAVGTPILLVHGLGDNRSVFTMLRRTLRRYGFGRVRTVNYSPLTSDVRTAARALGRQVEALCQQTGYEQIHVVGHSLGGIIARYYVQCLSGDKRVHTLVTLGSPHRGTWVASAVARVLPLRLCRQLRPDSHLMAELAAPAPDCSTRFLSVWTDHDQLIRPARSADLTHPDLQVRSLRADGVGHWSLPMDRRVTVGVVHALARLDGGYTGEPASPLPRTA
jgi:triacylglycerol lipase